MRRLDPVALARSLIRLDTAGPEAREASAMDLLAGLLAEAGFAIEAHAFAPGRPSVLARLDTGSGLPLVFSGHLDTVPVGSAPWRRPPLGAELADGILHGRGSADMKAGVAALVAAAVALAGSGGSARPLVLALTAGEEVGCLGALHLQHLGVLPRAAGILVAEPTGNRMALGHRGALWLQADYVGRSAHGSMPHLGRNAIYAAADGIRRCRDLRLPGHDPLLGAVSLNVGTVAGGLNVNSVPDHARFTIDIRSVAPGSHAALGQAVAEALGSAASLGTLIDLPAVHTPAADALARSVADAMLGLGLPDAAVAVPFFTDASILGPACAAPSVILGPGDPQVAHQIDECCPAEQIHEAAQLYERIGAVF